MGDHPIPAKQKSETQISPEVEEQGKLRSISERIFSVAEHGWCQLMLGILALFFGIVDGRYIAIVSVMALLAIHRSDSLKGLGRWTQASVYITTFCLLFAGLWIGGVEWNKDRDNSPLIKAISDAVGAKVGKPAPVTIAGPPPPAPIISAVRRSYLEYVGMPVFTGKSPNGTEGAPFSVGDPLSFNVHYRAVGPNPVTLLPSAFDTEVVGDLHVQNGSFDSSPIKKAVDAFLSEFKRESAKSKNEMGRPRTLMVGDAEFSTAFASTDNYTHNRLATQDDLDGIKAGTETFVVISILAYIDGNTTHHLRRCVWLQPSANPSGTWHYCEGNLPDSD